VRPPRLAVVLWNGTLGGAQTVTVAIAESLRRLGVHVGVVFVQHPWPLGQRLEAAGIPFTSIGLRRGRDVFIHPRRYAAGVRQAGADGALLVECGYIGATLRAGGYRGGIVAVEHGSLLGLERFNRVKRILWRIDRLSGAWANDAEVAVSDYMLKRMGNAPSARRTCRIHNGVDPAAYSPACNVVYRQGGQATVGFAGRLIPGKGLDDLLRAFAHASAGVPLRLLVAGIGPEEERLLGLTRKLGVASKVSFCGGVNDMGAFWHRCDFSATPSNSFVESFSMVTLEAMASGKACVASRNGAIPELVVDGVTGTLVTAGDIDEMAEALIRYATHPELSSQHGVAARRRAIEHFHIENCARAYLGLFQEIGASPSS
jgi:glycosyltransferase involved in cell wall biosynthesis